MVDNAGKAHERVYFGATVTFAHESGDERTVTIVGVDELDAGDTRISWRSPMATALLKARVGDVVTLRTPRGPEPLEIIASATTDESGPTPSGVRQAASRSKSQACGWKWPASAKSRSRVDG